MSELTPLQNKFLEIISRRGKNNPITGKEIASQAGMKERRTGKEGADWRAVINTLRDKGWPILAGSGGYWWPAGEQELSQYIHRFQARINAQQKALDGIKKGLDKIELRAVEKEVIDFYVIMGRDLFGREIREPRFKKVLVFE